MRTTIFGVAAVILEFFLIGSDGFAPLPTLGNFLATKAKCSAAHGTGITVTRKMSFCALSQSKYATGRMCAAKPRPTSQSSAAQSISSHMVADEKQNVPEEGTPRRFALKQILGGMLAASAVCEGEAHAAEVPEVTAKVFIDLKIVGRSKALDNAKWEKIITRDRRAATGGGKDLTARMVVGVYGKEAPKSVDMFLKLIKGELLAQCIDEDEAFDEDAFGVSDRDKQTKKQIYKQCKAREDVPLSYEYSIASRVVKDQRIDLGRMNKLFIAAPQNEDANTLLHTKGSLSVKRGGGEFDFTLAPGPNPALDKDNIVIGRVLEGFEVLDVLNQSPVSQGQFLEGAFKFSAKAIGDVRSKMTAQGKPLQKISIISCGVL